MWLDISHYSLSRDANSSKALCFSQFNMILFISTITKITGDLFVGVFHVCK